MSDLLKSVIQDLINDRSEQAEVTIHEYFVAKTQEVTGLTEKLWSGDVHAKWTPPEGFFSKSAADIASGLKSASTDLKQAMGRLSFYVNRAGKNLSAEDKARLEDAKKKLHASYE